MSSETRDPSRNPITVETPPRPGADATKAVQAPAPAARATSPLNRRGWVAGGIILVAVVSIALWRVVGGHDTKQTAASRVSVAVDKVRRESLVQEILCEAELRPFQEIEVHAKVAGFLESIPVDIGDRVKAGQLLAKLEIPELQAELEGATAAQKRNSEEVARASAAFDDAHGVYTRLVAVDKANPAYIAAQELDSARARDLVGASTLSASRAQVEVSNAEMNRLRTLLGYSRITAPFPGVITKRYADPGALIQAGTSSSTQTLPVVRLSQTDLLRLSIPVSVTYVSRIHVGDPVEIRVDALGLKLAGSIARTAGKVDAVTGTMETEVDVPNPDLKLIPGMYAIARLRLDHREDALTVPVLAVSREEPYSVFVVDKDDKVEERMIKVGLETANRYEVLEGLKESDLVLVGNRTQVKPGQRVKPEFVTRNAQAP